jgi:hypothetical protein
MAYVLLADNEVIYFDFASAGPKLSKNKHTPANTASNSQGPCKKQVTIQTLYIFCLNAADGQTDTQKIIVKISS